MSKTEIEIREVSNNISNFMYSGNLQATKELMELLDKISQKELKNPADYVRMYDNNFYTYQTWNDLVESEKDQNDGLTEEELQREFQNECGSIWQLPCGWYIQYV